MKVFRSLMVVYRGDIHLVEFAMVTAAQHEVIDLASE